MSSKKFRTFNEIEGKIDQLEKIIKKNKKQNLGDSLTWNKDLSEVERKERRQRVKASDNT